MNELTDVIKKKCIRENKIRAELEAHFPTLHLYIHPSLRLSLYLLSIHASIHPYLPIYQKVKWSRYRPGVAQRVGRGIALLLHDRGTRREWVVSSKPRPHFTPRKSTYTLLLLLLLLLLLNTHFPPPHLHIHPSISLYLPPCLSMLPSFHIYLYTS